MKQIPQISVSECRVRKLMGQARVPYNRGLRVRGSPHPFLSSRDCAGGSEQGVAKPYGLVFSSRPDGPFNGSVFLGGYPSAEHDAPGDVEVFELTGHPKAKRCYAWSHGEPEEFIAILELPPVDSAHSAVKVGVAYQIKRARKRI